MITQSVGLYFVLTGHGGPVDNLGLSSENNYLLLYFSLGTTTGSLSGNRLINH